MKFTIIFAMLVLAALFITGCQDEPMAPPLADPAADAAAIDDVTAIRMIDAEIFSAQCDSQLNRKNRNFFGILSGRQEVPPTDSRGRGVAAFRVSRDGDSISYKLIVANISNVIGVEIYRGVRGENGLAVLELYSDTTNTGRSCGPIAHGTFKPEDLIGPYAGATDFSLFLADLHADSLYVNVRTSDGVDSTSGRPGDYIDGEIRGQLHHLNWVGDWWKHHNDRDDHGKGKGHDKGKGKGHDKGKGKGHDKDDDGDDDGGHGDGGHRDGGHRDGGGG